MKLKKRKKNKWDAMTDDNVCKSVRKKEKKRRKTFFFACDTKLTGELRFSLLLKRVRATKHSKCMNAMKYNSQCGLPGKTRNDDHKRKITILMHKRCRL